MLHEFTRVMPTHQQPEPRWGNIARVLFDIFRIRVATSLAHISRPMLAMGLTRLSRRTLRLPDGITPKHLKGARWPRG